MEKSNVEKAAEKICEENKELRAEIEDKKCQIEEMRQYIECLKADLAEAQERKFELPIEPIKVASMMIDATETYETSSLAKKFGAGDKTTYKLYSNADLRQIAEHLLVYCNNSDGD